MTLWKLLTLLLIGTSLGALIARGQGAGPSDGSSEHLVKSGDYQPFNVLLRLKLGTAYYVNPQLVRDASVTYLYSLDELLQAGRTEKVIESLEDGQAAIAIGEGDGRYKVVQLDWKGASGTTSQVFLKDLRAAFGNNRLELVSTGPEFLGAKPLDSLVSLDAARSLATSVVRIGETTRILSPANAAWVR